MIFAKINTRTINNLAPKRELPRIAKVKEAEYHTVYYDRVDDGEITILGEGGHTKPYESTMEEDWDRKEETNDFDSWSELTIKLEKTEIIDICKLAFKAKIVKLHDILSGEELRELRKSSETLDLMKSELDKMLSIFGRKLHNLGKPGEIRL